MTVIASYPRSGSTWLRFIICNLYYPLKSHSFATVNKLVPDINRVETGKEPEFCKSHGLHRDKNLIYLYRHVGDVLISEWWYKRKYADDNRTLEEFLEADDYGRGWREHTDFYFPTARMISFEDLSHRYRVQQVLLSPHPVWEIGIAIDNSSFAKLQKAEGEGFGDYPVGDPTIKFIRCGKSGQWKELPEDIQLLLLSKNQAQLEKLGYL